MPLRPSRREVRLVKSRVSSVQWLVMGFCVDLLPCFCVCFKWPVWELGSRHQLVPTVLPPGDLPARWPDARAVVVVGVCTS